MEKNTGKVREFCQSGKVGTVILHPYYTQQESLMAGTTLFDVSGGDVRLPLTADTQPYCWSHPYLGVLLTLRDGLNDSTTVNNAAFYRIIFHCGGNGSFTLTETDSGTDSDSKPDSYIVLCRTCSHFTDSESDPYSYFCTGQEAVSESVPKSVFGNVMSHKNSVQNSINRKVL